LTKYYLPEANLSRESKGKKKKKNNLEIGATSAWLKGYIAH